MTAAATVHTRVHLAHGIATARDEGGVADAIEHLIETRRLATHSIRQETT